MNTNSLSIRIYVKEKSESINPGPAVFNLVKKPLLLLLSPERRERESGDWGHDVTLRTA
jgi:hypothetical protein